MATTIRRYVSGRPIEGCDWNDLVDHVERLQRAGEAPAAQPQPGVAAGAVLAGLALCGSTRRVTRRALLGLRWTGAGR